MYTSLFALLTREKEEETENFTELEGKKIPIIKKVTTVVEDQGEATDNLTTKETKHYETTLSGIRNAIKAHYAQMIAKAVAAEADKGVFGLITGTIAAAGFAAMFDSLVPEFAQGGIVPGSGNRDTVPAMLTPGELILNQSQQDNLAGNMGVTVNIGGNIIGEESFVRDTLIPEIEKARTLA